MELFKLHGIIDVDNTEANKKLKETGSQGEKTQGKLSKAFSAIGKGAVAVGKTIGVGLAAGGAAMGALTVKALNMSGELEQNMGGSEAVFKEYAGKMQETAKQAFSNMGLSTSDFLATANKMGALFQGAGFDIESSSDLAADAMQRAADVASIMGIDTSAAMDAIAGAAKGNFTMMDNLGVAMNDTTLNAYALEKGLNKTTQEMTNQEKIALAMEMFMDRTAYAAGNYAKENETLAGSLGTAKAALTNFLDGSGSVEQLVTAFSGAANVIVRNLQELAPRLINGLVDIVNQVIPMLPPLLNQLLPVIIQGAVSLINGLVRTLPMVIDALMAALPSLIAGVMQILNALIAAFPQIMQSLVSALPTLLPQLINGLVSLIIMLCAMLPEIIQPIIDYLPEIYIAVVDALMQNLPALIKGVVQLIAALIVAFPQIFSALWESLKGIFSTIGSYLWDWVSPAFEVIGKFFSKIGEIIWTGIRLIGSIFKAAFDIITLPFRFIWENIKEYVFLAWEWIKEKITAAVNGIKDFLQPAFDFIKEKIVNPIISAKDKVVETFNNIKSKIADTITNIKTSVTNTFNNIKDAMSKPIEKARDLIKDIVDKIKGFFSGLKINFPKIKLPHFSIKPKGWEIGDLLKGSIPKLGIDWYAKAMNNPMIMNKPTIFGYDPVSGNLRGGGEAGSEIVSGTNTLMAMISGAVASQVDNLAYLLQKLIEMLAEYFPEILEAMDRPISFDPEAGAAAMAVPMDRRLGIIKRNKERGR